MDDQILIGLNCPTPKEDRRPRGEQSVISTSPLVRFIPDSSTLLQHVFRQNVAGRQTRFRQNRFASPDNCDGGLFPALLSPIRSKVRAASYARQSFSEQSSEASQLKMGELQ
ncbi:hypothetical protein CG428_21695 [Pantoea ananatis]|nr:hypothetical protein CG428_21695 [Pantoea ananatis]